MSRAIITYAAGAHEEILDVAILGYRLFAARHGYDLCVTRGDLKESLEFCPNANELPPPWRKIPLLLEALSRYDEVVWLDCDLIVVDPSEDFPPLKEGKTHALVRHFGDCSEVPNSGVWYVRREIIPLLHAMLELEVFRNHGWWEQAALMTLMGYTVPPQGSVFSETKCRNVVQTKWYRECQFLRLAWNCHPGYRADRPRIVHCSYTDMALRLKVMRRLAVDPSYNYPDLEEAEK